jgi:hypothetical protein
MTLSLDDKDKSKGELLLLAALIVLVVLVVFRFFRR